MEYVSVSTGRMDDGKQTLWWNSFRKEAERSLPTAINKKASPSAGSHRLVGWLPCLQAFSFLPPLLLCHYSRSKSPDPQIRKCERNAPLAVEAKLKRPTSNWVTPSHANMPDDWSQRCTEPGATCACMWLRSHGGGTATVQEIMCCVWDGEHKQSKYQKYYSWSRSNARFPPTHGIRIPSSVLSMHSTTVSWRIILEHVLITSSSTIRSVAFRKLFFWKYVICELCVQNLQLMFAGAEPHHY